MMRHVIVLGLALGAILVGCTVGPNYVPPKPNLPDHYSETVTTTQASTRPATREIEQATARWWRNFEDPQLNLIIDRAVKGNLDLRVAEARLRQARAQYGIFNANFFPSVNGGGSYERARGGGGVGVSGAQSLTNGPSGTSTLGGLNSGSGSAISGSSIGTGGIISGGTATPALARRGSPSAKSASPSAARTASPAAVQQTSSSSGRNGGEGDLYQMGFDASWELDIWGQVRREVEAAGDNIDAAVENRRNVLVSLLGEVATTYIQYRGFQRELAIANENIGVQKYTLGITQQKATAGLTGTTQLEVSQAQALVYSTEAQVPALEQDMKQTAHKLAVLLGESPDALLADLATTKPIPDARIPDVPMGLPSDLLRRRPDIRNSERLLALSTANIGVAVADLFPQVTLSGAFGIDSSTFSGVTNYGNRSWSIGPAISWPIIDWGRIRSNIQVQNAIQEQAYLTYQETVLNALQEVEDSAVAYSREQVRRKSLSDAVEADKIAVNLATQRYNAGLTDFLSVLVTEQNLFSAEDALVQSEETVSANLVALYKALGGGWEPVERQQNMQTQSQQAKATAVQK
jgi:multidrug efflux system outer membrane protein